VTIPNSVVGEELPASIGPLETTLIVRSFEHEYTTVSYKPNRVRVTAGTAGSNRGESVVGPVEFTVTEDYWDRLNRSVETETNHSGGGDQ
jgi:hypothetical protein